MSASIGKKQKRKLRVQHSGALGGSLCRNHNPDCSSKRGEAEVLQFTAAVPPVLTGTMYTDDFSNS